MPRIPTKAGTITPEATELSLAGQLFPEEELYMYLKRGLNNVREKV